MKINIFYFLLPLCLFMACNNDDEDHDDDHDHEEEVITTLKAILTPDDASLATATFIFQDIDGDGGDDPVITLDSLVDSTTYTMSVELWNESEDPAEDITEEIEEEALEHQFFFSTTGGITVEYADEDTDGNPIGLSTTVTTGAAGTGSLEIILLHEPNKSADGVSDGDITNAEGETDIEYEFEVKVIE